MIRTCSLLPGGSLAFVGMLRFVHAGLSMAHVGLSVCVSLVLQVALMSAMSTAVAALDAQRGVVVVAERALGFLMNQSVAPENSVR